MYDLARCDMAKAVESAFRYDRLVVASPTYCNSVFPFMGDFLTRIAERDYKNRVVGFIENGSWAPTATKAMQTALANCKNLTFTQNNVRIMCALDDQSTAQVHALCDELVSLKK